MTVALAAWSPSRDPKVLLSETDVTTAHSLIDGLEQAGMPVVWGHDAAESSALKAQFLPDIVLVRLHLDGISSLGLVKHFVDQHDCGVIVLADVEDEAARMASLDLGADDYVSTRSVMWDMVARVRAVHRRVRGSHHVAAPSPPASTLTIGPIQINLQHRSVHTLEGARLMLTAAEYTVLDTLARAEGKPVSRDRLSDAALRRPWRAEDRSVDQLVFNLRQKLPMDADGGVLIQSIRGSGYWMRAPDKPSRRNTDAVWAANGEAARAAPRYEHA